MLLCVVTNVFHDSRTVFFWPHTALCVVGRVALKLTHTVNKRETFLLLGSERAAVLGRVIRVVSSRGVDAECICGPAVTYIVELKSALRDLRLALALPLKNGCLVYRLGRTVLLVLKLLLSFSERGHSPFLLSLKGAKIYDIDSCPVETKKWTELECVRVYREFFKENDYKF